MPVTALSNWSGEGPAGIPCRLWFSALALELRVKLELTDRDNRDFDSLARCLLRFGSRCPGHSGSSQHHNLPS